MSDESYSPVSDLSGHEHRIKAQYSTSEKNNCKTREFKRKSRCSRETERVYRYQEIVHIQQQIQTMQFLYQINFDIDHIQK